MSNASPMTPTRANINPRIVRKPPAILHLLIIFFTSSRFLKGFSDAIDMTSFLFYSE